MNETNRIPFSALGLPLEIERAVEQMGFDTATDVQSQCIPLIRSGYDVIGRSQTGTGKTAAFGIPALEAVEPALDGRDRVQVLILCPTRELAVQACGEIKKLAAYMHGIRAVEVYGGAPMDRQIMKLKRANIVVGTPGRVMDHMRRRTLRLDQVKMVVLDEADEMLSMGFREDIETILKDTPEERQTVLFSATMPQAILELTRLYQKEPQLVEINRNQITVSEIKQSFYEVPMGRKTDALSLLLRYYAPKRSIIFCNTKKMVDDINENLSQNGFSAEGLHGDMKQSQRTKVMDSFKQGRTAILIATDVAARGIDVSDIDFVINYDVPQNPEYYVHRIGRTGRAGRSGQAVTICSGRRQVQELLAIGKAAKSFIERKQLPDAGAFLSRRFERAFETVEALLETQQGVGWEKMVERLSAKGHTPEEVAAVLLAQQFGSMEAEDGLDALLVKPERSRAQGGRYGKLVISIGREQHVAPNHLVGAIAERTPLSGGDIGKIEIYDDRSVVAVPEAMLEEVVRLMEGCKICGLPVRTTALRQSGRKQEAFGSGKDYRRLKPKSGRKKRR